MPKKNIFYTLIVIAVVVGALILVANQDQRSSADKVVIAVNLPLTGPIAAATGAYPKGLKLGIEDECRRHSISPQIFAFDILDNQGKTQEGVAVFNKQKMSGFDVYVSGVSDVTMGIVKLVDETEKPHFLVAFDKHMPQYNKNRIRLMPNFNLEIPLYIDFIKKHSPKRVYSICHASSVNQELFTAGIEPFLEDNHIENYRENIDWSTSDYRTIAQKIKVFAPDIILINAFSGQMLKLIPALKELGLIKNNNTYCGLDFIDFLSIPTDHSFTQDIIFTASEYNVSKDPKIQEWNDHYHRTYGENPTYISAYAYDTGCLIVRAYLASKEITTDTLIKETPTQGITGNIVIDYADRDLKSTLVSAYIDADGVIKLAP